jgi:hypothetical protein
MVSIESILSIADFYGWLSIIASIIGAIFMYKANKKHFKRRIIAPIIVKPSVPRSTPIANLKRSLR